jgi:hypothetical protein
MIVVRHYPRRHPHRANVPVDLGSNGYVPRHRRCTPSTHLDMAVRIGQRLGWQCLSCGRMEVA